MEDFDAQDGNRRSRKGRGQEAHVGDIERATGETPAEMLDLDRWTEGEDYASMSERTRREVAEAVKREGADTKRIRGEIFQKISATANIPHAGLNTFKEEHIETALRGLLFNGAVEACDGTSAVHDTLPITITQIGVCLTSYRGEQGSYVHRIYRRDLRERGQNQLEEILEMLERRGKRQPENAEGTDRDQLSALLRRGLMAYAERALLLDKSDAAWRMGHGNPIPYELMTGHWAHREEMVDAALDLMRRLVDHRRFLFVPSEPNKLLRTLGNALRPREYLIVETFERQLEKRLRRGNYRGDAPGEPRWKVKRFIEEIAPQVVVGVYRASVYAPPSVFYTHKDHARKAALIAMADSMLQMHRGFPMLIDIADSFCRGTFNSSTFVSSVQQAYAETGQPFRYLSERETRP